MAVCHWVRKQSRTLQGNAVDGGLLETLSANDLTSDLGLSGLQAKKVLLELDFAQSLTSGGGGGREDVAQVQELQAALAEKDKQIAQQSERIAQLEQEVAALKPPEPVVYATPAPARAPQPTYYNPPPRREAHVLKGAAGGAARGAVTGAVGEFFLCWVRLVIVSFSLLLPAPLVADCISFYSFSWSHSR